ncbi:hypothetical protein C8R43DRAFT_1116764 [Mycena crocata]|nr:hypothetical protein C8R43DRAFT_1116764 [Mycena crocata]
MCYVEGWRRQKKGYAVITAAFFEALPCFVNVRQLVMWSTNYDQIFLRNTRLLPQLTCLEISFGSAAEGEEINSAALPLLDVSKFSLICSPPIITTASQHWVPFLRRDKLLDVDLDCGEQIYTEILAGDSFPRVKRLTITLDVSKPFLNLQILRKFHAVEVLEVWLGYPDPAYSLCGPVGALVDIMPFLTELNAPEELLPWFLPIPTFRRLTLPWRKATDRVITLRPFKPLENITDLSFVVSDLDHEILRDICVVFPNLTALRVTVAIHLWDDDVYDEPYAWEVSTFFAELAIDSPLPCNLQKISFRWKIEDGPAHAEVSPPDLHQMKEFLSSEHTALQAIWLDGPSLFYYWSVSEGGLGMQYDDDGARGKEGYWEEVNCLRPRISFLWDQI